MTYKENIIKLLAELVNVSKSFKPMPEKIKQGSFNIVRFGKLNNTAIAYSEEKKQVQIEIAQANQAQQYLVDYNVDCQFILKNFYYDSSGCKASPEANQGSLYDFCQKKKELSYENFKEIIGQIVLGVAALHNKNLAHRDLSIYNILIHSSAPDQYLIQIGDLDNIIAVDSVGNVTSNDIAINGTAIPPEFNSLIDRKKNQWYSNILNNYLNINFKKVDCYMVGYLAHYLFKKSYQPIDKLKDAALVQSFYRRLMDDNPALRPTINQIMKDEFFGENAEQRISFFRKLKLISSDFYMNNYVARSPGLNHPFFLIDAEVQDLYFLIEKLSNKIDLFERDSFKIDLPTRLKAEEAIINQIEEFKNNLREFIENKESYNNHQEKINVLTAIEAELDSIKKFIHETNSKIVEKYIVNLQSMIKLTIDNYPENCLFFTGRNLKLLNGFNKDLENLVRSHQNSADYFSYLYNFLFTNKNRYINQIIEQSLKNEKLNDDGFEEKLKI